MLTLLKIDSLGLIDKAEFAFQKGFTSITGETGSGKTSLIEALLLCLGKKSSFDFIKTGALKATVEAHFELEASHPLFQLFEKALLAIEKGELLIFKRELQCEGKTKAFINQMPVSLHFLQKCAPFLISYMDQEALFSFKDPLFFLEFLDKTLSDPEIFNRYAQHYAHYKKIQEHLEILQAQAEQKDFHIERLGQEVLELKEAHLIPDEEKELFSRYKTAQNTLEQTQGLSRHLEKLNQELLPSLKKLRQERSLGSQDQRQLSIAYEQLCDVSMNWERQLSSALIEPEELARMEARLSLLHKLKKKYQKEADELIELLETKKNELKTFLNVETELFKLQSEFSKHKAQLEALAITLHKARQCRAREAEKQLEAFLKPLNFPFIALQFVLEPMPLGPLGMDKIELWMQAHPDVPLAPAKESASGGELARLNFALFITSSNLSPATTYVFDEIDSSVGGITASLMGDKLQELAQCKQVFCITHFPQMAAKGSQHWVFEKVQTTHKTEVQFRYSQQGPIAEEIDRMSGVQP